MSMAPEYIVEVRDRDFKRVGQIDAEFLDIKYIEVFRGIGAWELKLPAEHPLLDTLKTKGAGIIITNTVTGQVFSGRMREAVLSQDAADPKGTWLITGQDDNVIGAATSVYPDPANLANAQSTDYWNYNAPNGETAMKTAVALNIGASAIASRKYSWLSVATNANRGAATRVSARFQQLGEVLTSIGVKTGLGWKFYQSGAGIVFDVYVPTDKSANVRLDIRNGGLESTQLGYSAPSATEVLVLGQGQGASRTVRRVVSTAAAAEAALWGLRWEVSKDQRNTDNATELQQAGEEILTTSGTTIHSLKVVPSDAPNQRIGIDWGLGDIVAVIMDETPATAVVAEIATSISAAGVIRTATVGDPIGFDWDAKVSSKVRAHESRISDLETQVDSTPAPPGAATTTTAGLLAIATSAETNAEIVANKAVTPATLAAYIDSITGPARNLCLNPGGINGTSWGTGPNLSAVYSGSTPPVWTLMATSGNAYIRVPFAPFVAGRTYRFRIRLSNVSGAVPTSIGVIANGSLPFTSLGGMTAVAGGWIWEGAITPTANAANPEIWLDFYATSSGGKTTLAEYVIAEENRVPGPSFDGSSQGAYVTAWDGTAFASSSTAYRRLHP